MDIIMQLHNVWIVSTKLLNRGDLFLTHAQVLLTIFETRLMWESLNFNVKLF